VDRIFRMEKACSILFNTIRSQLYIYNYVCIILNQLAIEHANKSQVNSIAGVFFKKKQIYVVRPLVAGGE
jgi:mannitol/fructose-specific phosphotransferase system IIA component (Ntr-type)